MKKRAIMQMAVLPLLAAFLQASPQSFDFEDPKGVNNASFRLDAPLETITGTTTGVSGTLSYDHDDPGSLSGFLVIDATTLHVDNPVMKEHLHGATWMNTAEHGEIRFEVVSLSEVEREGDVVRGKVTGQLSMMGVTREITVPATATLLPGMLGPRTNGAMEGDLLVVRTTFSISREDFGINPDAPRDKVADEVQIQLAVAGAAPEE